MLLQRPIFFYGKPEVPADKITKLKETLKILEEILDTNLYVAGNNPTIADISTLSTFIMFQGTFRDFQEIPNVKAWYQRCQLLPGFQENIAGRVDRTSKMK